MKYILIILKKFEFLLSNFFKFETILGSVLRLFRHDLLAKKKSDRSNNNEYKFVEKTLNNISIFKGYAVDLGASDGLNYSCTYPLFLKGWNGLCVELDDYKFLKLTFLYRYFKNVKLQKVKITPKNIKEIFISADVKKEFEFLNLDIDSYDLEVMEEILKSDFRPALISMEINEKMPPEIFFCVKYDKNHFWQGDHFYGCSLAAANEVLSKYDYSLVSLEWDNAFFILNKFVSKFNIKKETVLNAYDKGYRNRIGRKERYYYNSNLDKWLYMSTDEALSDINKYFMSYNGKYILRKSKSSFAN